MQTRSVTLAGDVFDPAGTLSGGTVVYYQLLVQYVHYFCDLPGLLHKIIMIEYCEVTADSVTMCCHIKNASECFTTCQLSIKFVN